MRAEVEANNKAVNSAIDATKEYLGPYFENTCRHFMLRSIKYYETTRQNRKSRQYWRDFSFLSPFSLGERLFSRLGSCGSDHLAVAGAERLSLCDSDHFAEQRLRGFDCLGSNIGTREDGN